MEITIDELRDANISESIAGYLEYADEMEMELSYEMYESLELNGIFTVKECTNYSCKNVIECETELPWSFLKRRILSSTCKTAGISKCFRFNGVIAYEFYKGLHMTDIADARISSIVLQFDDSDYKEDKPVFLTTYLKY